MSAVAILMRAFEARFYAKVEKTDGCWLWKGARHRLANGTMTYGTIMLTKGRTALAHRVSYELANGDLSDDAVLRHTCDNPACVRPDHLVAGTQQDNLADMREKGRDRWATLGQR